MRKDLKKNKKGFTLVEIIVVLLIIGILLAITIPSIMGYVGKAKDAQYEAEGRTGFVAAQTILTTEVSGKASVSDEEGADIVSTKITAENVAKEVGETDGTTVGTVKDIHCELTDDNKNIKGCSIQTTGTGVGTGKKWVNFTAAAGTDSPKVEVSSTQTYPTTK